MATFDYESFEVYDQNGNSTNYAQQTLITDEVNTVSDDGLNTTFEVGETVTVPGGIGGDTGPFTFVGIDNTTGTTLVLVGDGVNTIYALSPEPSSATTFPPQVNSDAAATAAGAGFTPCFAQGTLIATPSGEVAVEELVPGQEILSADGSTLRIEWIGQRRLSPRFCPPDRVEPILFAAGSLGGGLPHSDLMVTTDHGMILDGLLINAAALVNGRTITRVPARDLPEVLSYYHIETKAHAAILANGAPAETFVDYASRAAFDNFADYVAAFGAERVICEMPLARIASARCLPMAVRTGLGIANEDSDTNADTAQLRRAG